MKSVVFTLLALAFTTLSLHAEAGQPQFADTSKTHELTIFTAPSLHELDWSSPSSLLESTFKSYSKSILRKHAFSIGHVFIELSTPLLDTVIMTSVRTKSTVQERRLVLDEMIGMGILGADMEGRMETRKELLGRISHYSANKRLTFIKFRLNEESARRVIDYIKMFTSKTKKGCVPCNYYGGAFWPRYENEGAGCSAFGMSVMQVAGLEIDYPEWMISVNIPMSLVGGEYNNHKKISRRAIRRCHSWYNGKGTENIDYIYLSIYDPSLIYNWIINKIEKIQNSTTKGHGSDKDSDGFTTYTIKGIAGTKRDIRGLYMDARSIVVPPNEPLMLQRNRASLFIDIYKKHLNLL